MAEHTSAAKSEVNDPRKKHQLTPEPSLSQTDSLSFQPSFSLRGAMATQHVMSLQRLVGNQATIQMLRGSSLPADDEGLSEGEAVQEHGADVDVSRLIQRAPLMTGEAMLTVSPHTTGLLGGKKTSLYNSLVDSVKSYWTYVTGTKRKISIVSAKLNAIVVLSDGWMAKHGTSTSAKDVTKRPAVSAVRDNAKALQTRIAAARAALTEKSGGVESLYADARLWATITEWSDNAWHFEENTNFYSAYRDMTTVEEGKAIIEKHLVEGRSPEPFNVSGPLYVRARALQARPNLELDVATFQALFLECSRGATQVWDDLRSKVGSDDAAYERDSFVFSYILEAVPDIRGT